jgi:hypothetical protein
VSQSIANIVVPRLVATALSVSLAAWAVAGIRAYSADSTVRSLAAAVEGGQPQPEGLERFDKNGSSARIMANCDTASLRALATLLLKEFDLTNSSADPIRAGRASERAETAVRKTLSCAPLDGASWLRLAVLDNARRGPSSRTVELIKLSHWTAPSEAWIVRSRVQFVSRLFEEGVKELQPELRSDIRKLVNTDWPLNVAEMFVSAPGSVRHFYLEWIALLPANRQRRLANAVERLGGNLNGT